MGNEKSVRPDHVAATGVRAFAHAGITVGKMERALGFYRDLLGLVVEADYVIDAPYIFRITRTTGMAIRIVYLRVPGSDFHVELLEYRGCEQQVKTGRPCDPGNGHLCLAVNDLASICRRLAAAGVLTGSDGPVEITQGPRSGNQALYAADPDGYYIELVQEKSSGRVSPANICNE